MNRQCCLCLLEGKNAVKRAKQGKAATAQRCEENCTQKTHWWCNICSSKNYREKKARESIGREETVAQTQVREEINEILFAEEPIISLQKKKGRPKLPLEDLHPNTKRKRFNEGIMKIIAEIEALNKLSDDNSWGLKLGMKLEVFNDDALVRQITKNCSDEPTLTELQNMLTKLAFLKVKLS